MVREDGGDGEIVVPPTIQALLAGAPRRASTRDERDVIERGSVEGEVFHRGAVAALAPDAVRPASSASRALVRKELIRPTQPTFPSDEAFRFRHLLIRDAAYEALPKATRAELHERFADWLDARSELVELRRDRRLPPRAGAPLPRRARPGSDAALLGARRRAAEHLSAAGRGRDGSRRLGRLAQPASPRAGASTS